MQKFNRTIFKIINLHNEYKYNNKIKNKKDSHKRLPFCF